MTIQAGPTFEVRQNARTINNIQALRAIAAIIVVLGHVQPILNAAFLTNLDESYGDYGVDIFFVISGFIMFYTNKNFDKSTAKFMINRVFRIVPLYWVATLLIAAFYLIGFRPNGLMYLDLQILLKSLFFIPAEFPGNRHDLVLSLGWTLMFELFFYASFAATFVFKSLERSFAILCAAFAALILSRYIAPSPIYLVEFFRWPILVEFLYGAALAVIFLREGGHPLMRNVSLGALLLATGFLLPVLVTAIDGEASVALAGLRFVVLGLPAFAMVAGAVILENAGLRIQNRAVLLLGAASYALYLFHPPLVQGTIKIIAIVLKNPTALNATLATAVALGVALIGAVVVHLVLERPILAASHRLTAKRGQATRLA